MARPLEGKSILLTGATEGIGKAAAVELARRGASLTIVGRNPEKTERVARELEDAGGARPEVLLGDLSRLADIRAVAAAFRQKHDRLDVLANNAGGLYQTHQLSADGFEMTFALNHLSYFLLTRELLELLRKTPGARIVSTSSHAHFRGKPDVEDWARRPSGRAGFDVYGATKLANILFTRELSRRLQGTGVTANCFHPGFVATGFGMNNGPIARFVIGAAMALVARTPEKGAETLVYLAASPDCAAVTGEYWMDCKTARRSRHAMDDALAARLWSLSEEACGAS